MTRATIVKDGKAEKYEFVPPEGGWGYVITMAMSLTFIVTVVPLAAFGLVFGGFLASLGDETGGTTLVNGIFNTVLSFTGLAANQLLQKCTCRKVGLLGAFLFFLGSFSTIFVTSLTQMVLSFGVLQGLGFGLMMPSVLTSFHGYFKQKQNVMMGTSQAIIVAVTIAWPVITKYLMENYGFRGTAAIFSALSLNCFVAMCTLQPAEWHFRKRRLSVVELEKIQNHDEKSKQNDETEKKTAVDAEPLLDESYHQRDGLFPLTTKTVSIVSLNGYAASSQQIDRVGDASNEKLGIWQSIAKSLDLGLFKDVRYCNISCGLSLGIISDLAFMSIMPLLLVNYKFNPAEITLIMTIYFIADLASRILLTIISSLIRVWNRYVFLAGALLSAVFRTAFLMNDTFLWTASVTAILGFLRCWIQTPLPLVVAEQYGPRFTTAFSLYMVVCGVVSLTVGVLSGLVKKLTNSDEMVVHLLTLMYLLCAIPWSIEILVTKMSKKQKVENDN